MSSPLQSLSKEKRNPISPNKNFGKRSMPFRNADYSISERLLLEDIGIHSKSQSPASISPNSLTPRNLLEPLTGSPREIQNGLIDKHKQTSPFTHNKKSQITKAPPSDMDLMATMMQRIAQLEKRNLGYAKEIIEKDKRIKVLEEKVLLYQKTNVPNSDQPARVADLERKCLELQQQLYEMETFLADYGMIWVGDKSDPNSAKYVDENNMGGRGYNDWEKVITDKQIDFEPDYDLILKNVKELNVIAGEGEYQVHKTGGGARLKESPSIRLVLYKNGLVLFNGPFRSYNDSATRRCMTDLMDGFFPSELQKKYPDGVSINAIDQRSTVFRDPRILEEFPGVGHLLGGEHQPSSLLTTDNTTDKQSMHHKASSMTSQFQPVTSIENSPLHNKDEKLNSQKHVECTSDLHVPKQSMEQFVNKLPKSVIRNGKIVDVRSSLTKHLTEGNSGENSTEIVETDVVEEMQKRMRLPEDQRPVSARDVTTLRVKSEDGKKNFLIKMKFSSTIQDVRKYIDKQRPRHKSAYDIVSNFPTKIHSNNAETLQHCGLVPNANICLRPRKNNHASFK